MVTLGQIQLRGFCTLNPDLVKEFLNPHAGREKQEDQWHETLELYDAFLTVTGFDPTTPCLEDFIALRGFMNAEMEYSEDSTKDIASQLCDMFIRANVLSETEASLVLSEAQLQCNKTYLARAPSKPQLLVYQSVFPTKEPGCPAYVDFASLGSALSDSSLQFLSNLLSNYLASLTCEQAATDAGLIIGLAQGLLYQNPGIDFGDIHLPATSSTEFISVARASAEWQMHGAGFFREDVAENWKYISTVILNFFVANNVLHLDKAGRRLLAPN